MYYLPLCCKWVPEKAFYPYLLRAFPAVSVVCLYIICLKTKIQTLNGKKRLTTGTTGLLWFKMYTFIYNKLGRPMEVFFTPETTTSQYQKNFRVPLGKNRDQCEFNKFDHFSLGEIPLSIKVQTKPLASTCHAMVTQWKNLGSISVAGNRPLYRTSLQF